MTERNWEDRSVFWAPIETEDLAIMGESYGSNTETYSAKSAYRHAWKNMGGEPAVVKPEVPAPETLSRTSLPQTECRAG